jgi:hypothetical protein
MLFLVCVVRSCLRRSGGQDVPGNIRAKPTLESLEERTLLDGSSFVRSLYADVLHRAKVSQAEVDGWVSLLRSGIRREDAVRAFVESTEHRARFVSDDYQRLLGRAPEPQGLDFWVQQMAAGMREDQVEAAFLSSAEYRQRQGGTDDGFLDGLYRDELHRGADDAGKSLWKAQLRAGVSRDQVATAFVTSHEAHVRTVEKIYQEILHRQPDEAGRHVAEDRLDRGLREFQLEEAFADASEYGHGHGLDE